MENKQLLGKMRIGDREARNLLIENNVGLVWSIVKKFSNRGYETEDIFQIGCVGLIKAVDKFDESFGVEFSTYAVPMIMGEIKRFMRDDGIIKISRSLKENNWKLRKIKEDFFREKGREPTICELESMSGINKEDIIQALEIKTEVDSIYRNLGGGEEKDRMLIDTLENESVERDAAEKLLNRMCLMESLENLDETQKKIIIMRYFMDKTQSEIADELNISQVQVSRMEKKILLSLRKTIGD